MRSRRNWGIRRSAGANANAENTPCQRHEHLSIRVTRLARPARYRWDVIMLLIDDQDDASWMLEACLPLGPCVISNLTF